MSATADMAAPMRAAALATRAHCKRRRIGAPCAPCALPVFNVAALVDGLIGTAGACAGGRTKTETAA
ncbi:MAG: hypothetical protein AAF899_18655 [Pseudomonadota bacterium]